MSSVLGIALSVTALVGSCTSAACAQENEVPQANSRQHAKAAQQKLGSKNEHGSLFEIPDAALIRSLGMVTPGPCSPKLSQVCEGATATPFETLNGGYPMSLPGLGIPLGGIGAGSFMINQAGTFGPWNFGGGVDERWEVRILPQAAFHVREQVDNGPPLVKTLAVPGPQITGKDGPVKGRSWGSPLPAWHPLRPGDGTYAALYPFGWINYRTFRTDISLRFFSPIVIKEDRRSSLPVAYFDMRIANNTAKPAKVSAMFTMPNASPHEGRTPNTVRSGLTAAAFTDDSLGIKGLTLRSDSLDNTPDAKASEWTIAARPPSGANFSYASSWNADGDGADIYRPFESSGSLSNSALDQSYSAGAIAVTVELNPGQDVTIPFVLSWDFPQVTFADNKLIYMRRYTNFYGARETDGNDYIKGSYPFHQSKAIAIDALTEHDDNLAVTEAWWKPLTMENAYPTILRTAALNQLYQIVFNDSFWEGGLVSNALEPTFGKRAGISVPGMHLFATADSGAGNNAGNSLDVNSYDYLSYNLLFPNLERDRLIAFSEALERAPHYTDVAADIHSGPFVIFKDLPECAAGKDNFIDIPSKFIARAYAYSYLNHDDGFLKRVYPAMSKALHCLENEVPEGSQLPIAAEMGRLENSQSDVVDKRPRTFDFQQAGKLLRWPNTFDTIFTNGPDSYDSELYLLSLEIMIEAGKRLGADSSEISVLSRRLVAAKAEFEKVLWDAKQGYYAYTISPEPGQDTVLLDTFFAQHIAERLQLPDLVDVKHYQQQLNGTYSAFMAWRDAEGRLVGAPNMVAGKGVKEWPVLGVLGAVQEEGVWPGVNYFVGSTYVAAGKRFGSEALTDDGVEMGSAVSAQIWLNAKNGYAFNTPMSWDRNDTAWYIYPAYERELAIWDLLNSIKPVRFPH